MPGPDTYIQRPQLEKDPVRFYQNQPTEETLQTFVLNAAFAETKEDGCLKNERSHLSAVQVPLNKTSDKYSNDTRKKLINFAKLLYHVHVFPFTSSPSKLNFPKMEDLDWHAFSDSIFLWRFLLVSEQERASVIFFRLDPSRMHFREVHFFPLGWPQKWWGVESQRSQESCKTSFTRNIYRRIKLH